MNVSRPEQISDVINNPFFASSAFKIVLIIVGLIVIGYIIAKLK